MATLTQPPSLRGVNHIKIPVFSLQKTHEFYTKILPFKPLPQYNHFTPDHKLFAQMFTHEPTKLIVEIRYDPATAEKQKGWDPITWGVGNRPDLEEWSAWFEANGVSHSKIFTAIKGWVMAAEDPDGKIVRLYVEDEDHEWTDHPDQDEYWLGKPAGDPDADGIA